MAFKFNVKKPSEQKVVKSSLTAVTTHESMAERRLQPIQESMLEMYQLTLDLYKEALDLFNSRDVDKALEIIESDDEIIKIVNDLNEAIVIYIVKNAPMASDLRKVITILKVATDLERIAKYSSHYAKFIIKNKDRKASPAIRDSWDDLGAEVVLMLEEIKDLYNTTSKNQIIKVSERQEVINAKYKQLMKEIVSEIKHSDDEEVIDYYIQLLPIVKFQERAGDHAKNICEVFLFLARGKFYNI